MRGREDQEGVFGNLSLFSLVFSAFIYFSLLLKIRLDEWLSSEVGGFQFPENLFSVSLRSLNCLSGCNLKVKWEQWPPPP